MDRNVPAAAELFSAISRRFPLDAGVTALEVCSRELTAPRVPGQPRFSLVVEKLGCPGENRQKAVMPLMPFVDRRDKGEFQITRLQNRFKVYL
ncbi:MAG: hypothetical protein GWP05_09330 [Anaerolineaceae bacterium]|nr:hypothetical protein [Anaerolineaceae bacterium]